MGKAANLQDSGDDIDIFGLFQTLWQGKVVIVGSAVLALVFGFLISLNLETEYRYSVSYSENYAPFTSSTSSTSAASLLIGSGFQVNEKNSIILLVNNGAEGIDEISEKLDEENKKISLYLAEKAASDLEILDKLPVEIAGTEIMAEQIFQNSRIVRDYSSGTLALTFAALSMDKFNLTYFVLAAFASAGLILGGFAVVIREAYRNYKIKAGTKD